MRAIVLLIALILAGILDGGIQGASAQLEPFQDYDISDAIWIVTTVKVEPNMGDDYLEGIRETWVAGNEIAKELGQIEDYSIFRSTLEQGGDWNLLLIVKFKNTADLAPSKARYKAFLEKWGEDRQEQTRTIAKDYPAMRRITGQYQVREITFKDIPTKQTDTPPED